MKSKLLFLFTLLVLVETSCKKEEIYHAIPTDFAMYTLFPAGTYWVYTNTENGRKVDSILLTESTMDKIELSDRKTKGNGLETADEINYTLNRFKLNGTALRYSRTYQIDSSYTYDTIYNPDTTYYVDTVLVQDSTVLTETIHFPYDTTAVFQARSLFTATLNENTPIYSLQWYLPVNEGSSELFHPLPTELMSNAPLEMQNADSKRKKVELMDEYMTNYGIYYQVYHYQFPHRDLSDWYVAPGFGLIAYTYKDSVFALSNHNISFE